MRWLLFAALPVLAAGCTTVDDPFLETGAIRPTAPALSDEVSPDFAAAYLPAVSGGVETVRQTLREDGLDQKIVYPNATTAAGENLLTVRIGKPSSGADFLRPPTRRAVLAEMRRALPGVAMTIEPTPGRNSQGVYGYATGALGKSGGCLYAWQFVKRAAPAGGLLASGAHAAQMRLRFCHPAMSGERLVGLMDGLRLKPVTDRTFDMLAFAGNEGRAPARAVVIATEDADTRMPARRAERMVADEARASDPALAEKRAEQPTTIRDAVRVPLPGEAVQHTVAGKPSEAEATATRTAEVLVPLPATAETSGGQ
jgi:hypothetical protein